MIKVTIIIPMKNEEENIALCLATIVKNRYPKDQFEIICVDNGSEDKTVEIAKKFTDKVFVLPTSTISSLRNFGAKEAKGEYIAFVDADCTVDEDWIAEASRYFDNARVVCFGSTPGIPEDATWVQTAWYLNKAGREEVQTVQWLESMNLFIRKDVFWEVGGFDEELLTCEDVDLCYRIGGKYSIMSDKKIKVIHLGEAKTLKEFFKKERWRGKSNLKGLKNHGVTLREIPSIVLPLYYLSLPFISLFLFYFLKAEVAIWAVFLLWTGFPFALSLYTTRKASRVDYCFQVTLVYSVYFIARAASLVQKG